jgi:hypothetical protein
MVALSPLAGAGWQFFNNNGVPLAGGKLFSYAAGTTTPLATYTSKSGGTAHSNPIILDSTGRVSSEVWLTLDRAYKFTLKNAANVEIWTKDNIEPNVSASDLASHMAGLGASLVGLEGGGTAQGLADIVFFPTLAAAKAEDITALANAVTKITIPERGDWLIGDNGDVFPAAWEDVVWFQDAGGTYWKSDPSVPLTYGVGGVVYDDNTGAIALENVRLMNILHDYAVSVPRAVIPSGGRIYIDTSTTPVLFPSKLWLSAVGTIYQAINDNAVSPRRKAGGTPARPRAISTSTAWSSRGQTRTWRRRWSGQTSTA